MIGYIETVPCRSDDPSASAVLPLVMICGWAEGVAGRKSVQMRRPPPAPGFEQLDIGINHVGLFRRRSRAIWSRAICSSKL